jgi:hypothetical protein
MKKKNQLPKKKSGISKLTLSFWISVELALLWHSIGIAL